MPAHRDSHSADATIVWGRLSRPRAGLTQAPRRRSPRRHLGRVGVAGKLKAGFDVIRKQRGSENGYCDFSHKQIAVRPDVAPAQAVKTLVHELGHALLHAVDPPSSREIAEVEVESVAFVVCDAQESSQASTASLMLPRGREVIATSFVQLQSVSCLAPNQFLIRCSLIRGTVKTHFCWQHQVTRLLRCTSARY